MRIKDRDAAPEPTHYLWWFPGCPLKVRLSLNVVRCLCQELERGDPNGVRGLLFGRTAEGVTEVLDFQPVSDSILDAAAASNKDAHRLLVGYYRTEAGASIRLNDEDQKLGRSYFTRPYQIFLVIQTSDFGPPLASFFFHDGEGRIPEFSLMEFPLEPTLLAGEENGRVRHLQEAAVRRAATFQAPAPPRRRAGPRVGTVAVILALIAALGYVVFREPLARNRLPGIHLTSAEKPPAAPQPPPSPLAVGLRARRDNADVEITWDRQAPAILAAISGVLSIRDGDATRELALTASEVRASNVVYSPSSGQVSIQLSLASNIGPVVESVVLLLPERNIPQAAPPGAPATKPAAASPLHPFKPPPAVGRAAGAAEREIPGAPRMAVALPADASNVVLPPILIAQQALPLAPVRTVDAPVGASQSSQPVVRPSVYYPPEPVHRVSPQFPARLRPWLPLAGGIDVRVAIDSAGRVTRADAGPLQGVRQEVVNYILVAVRAWSFKPARLGSEPVASEFLIRFTFGR